MISIGKPYVFEKGNKAYLKARVDISSDAALLLTNAREKDLGLPWRFYENYPPAEWKMEDSGLWFSVDLEYKDYLCAERSDAFVVAMLWYAMVTGSDISFEAPVSEKLYFGIRHMLLPIFIEKGVSDIHLIGPVTCEKIQSEGAVGTGMSCGVDSLYTLKKYNNPEMLDSYRLTHLVYMNMGNIFHLKTIVPEAETLRLDDFYAKTEEIALQKIQNAKEVADESGLPLVVISSNIDRDYYRGGYGGTATYRNCAGILALSGLFGTYYLSSSGTASSYIRAELYGDSDEYEQLLGENLSTEALNFCLADFTGRGQKILSIADDEVAFKHLDVCFNFCNCGRCRKCVRTLLYLDAAGKLDCFSCVFDTEAYRREQENMILKYMEVVLSDSRGFEKLFFREIRELAEEHNAQFAAAIDKVMGSCRLRFVKLYHELKKITDL